LVFSTFKYFLFSIFFSEIRQPIKTKIRLKDDFYAEGIERPVEGFWWREGRFRYPKSA